MRLIKKLVNNMLWFKLLSVCEVVNWGTLKFLRGILRYLRWYRWKTTFDIPFLAIIDVLFVVVSCGLHVMHQLPMRHCCYAVVTYTQGISDRVTLHCFTVRLTVRQCQSVRDTHRQWLTQKKVIFYWFMVFLVLYLQRRLCQIFFGSLLLRK